MGDEATEGFFGGARTLACLTTVKLLRGGEQRPSKSIFASMLIDRINKTGDTGFAFSHIKAQIGENVFVPNGALNKLRRDAISGLCDKLLKKYYRNDARYTDMSGLTALPEHVVKSDAAHDEAINDYTTICSCMTRAQLDTLISYECFDVLSDNELLEIINENT